MRVVAQLGLGHAVNTKVGGPDVRGLSGGERRRVSIGLQIVKSPSLLFLDEPTSGLDAHTSAKLVSSLRDLANEGRTVVATIHQPSAALFEQFDRLVLLSAGKTVFSGTRTAALPGDIGLPRQEIHRRGARRTQTRRHSGEDLYRRGGHAGSAGERGRQVP